MMNSTDVSDMKMTRFGYRVDLIRERHVRVKDEAKIASRETDWYECVKDDIKALGLHPEWTVFRDMWRGFISGGTSNPS